MPTSESDGFNCFEVKANHVPWRQSPNKSDRNVLQKEGLCESINRGEDLSLIAMAFEATTFRERLRNIAGRLRNLVDQSWNIDCAGDTEELFGTSLVTAQIAERIKCRLLTISAARFCKRAQQPNEKARHRLSTVFRLQVIAAHDSRRLSPPTHSD
jgi:hypothetical protein